MLKQTTVNFGCDPELFAESNGIIIGSERIIPEDGIGGVNKLIRDGIQVEMNIYPSTCREAVAANIASTFRLLKDRINTINTMGGKNFKASFAPVVKVTKEELNALSEKSRTFGCSPSFNVYNPGAVVHADASKYLVRSAGGHVHLGLLPFSIYMTQENVDTYTRYYTYNIGIFERQFGCKVEARDHRSELVPILDLLLGNTCVLLDRAPGQDERRKNYGRAGEYRLPKFGIEYRTLSNFWLRDYVLMSFVLGMARMAVSIMGNSRRIDSEINFEDELLRGVDFQKVVDAINNNDVDLAWENFRHVEQFVKKYVRVHTYGDAPLSPARLVKFKQFARDVQKYGIERIFPTDPLDAWTGKRQTMGWEKFITSYTPVKE